MKTTCLEIGPRLAARICILSAWIMAACTLAAAPAVEHDAQNKRVILSDASRNLILRLRYDGRCLLDQVRVGGRTVVQEETGVCSAIKLNGQWFTTREGIPTPAVAAASNSVSVSGIQYGGRGVKVAETWQFDVLPDRILWRISREYDSDATLEDTYFPGWDFCSMSAWTGALLGHGGVAWCKLFDAPNASYGVHNGDVTFWHKDHPVCLRIAARSDSNLAVRFSRQPSGVFSFNHSITPDVLQPKHGLSRFRRNEQDIWQPFKARQGRAVVEFELAAPLYDQAFDRGEFKGVDGKSIREICHTIGRIGAVDESILGSNGYYSDVAVLHEPWLAQMGLAIDDPSYFRSLASTLDFQRLHAIGRDGRVKSRWAGAPGDEMPGTYDRLGFYECQWGWLMDSQPSWVINVAELFDFTGSREWLIKQKPACELVLDYLLRRDTDGNGLVEMMTSSHKEARGSDWIDVVWASHENALVNAQMYWAMTLWSGLESLLGDSGHATRYAQAAASLKRQFNKNIEEGGFWDAQHQTYAYWRDKDGSIHGTNIVVPVNFSAIGYGLCDEPSRRKAVLDQMERLMDKEHLFFWPLCFESYAKEEVHPSVNWPFPAYENGDLFLAWGELGTRAYAAHNPGIAVKYVKNVLTQYAKDGLAFQRYLRQSQSGAGNDILANNCSIIVGLYRNIYGIQPKFNRLYLDPHLTPELNGTKLNYWLRDQCWNIDLNESGCAVRADGLTLRSQPPFAMNVQNQVLEYFHGTSSAPVMAVEMEKPGQLETTILSWENHPSAVRRWSVSCTHPGLKIKHKLSGLAPGARHTLKVSGKQPESLLSSQSGEISFECRFANSDPLIFELKQTK